MNTTKRKLNTENFLNSYVIRQKMSEVSGYDENEDPSVDLEGIKFETNPFDTNVACGQVRLLSDVEEIVYVAVLREINAETFLIMPFSHYDFPATDKEFKTDFDGGMYLNTLQTWNAKVVKLNFLKRSWLVGHLPDTDCKNALKFCDDKPLNNKLRERTGLPILSSDDIRNKYLLEESMRIDSRHLALEEKKEATPPSVADRVKQRLFSYDFPSIFENLKPQKPSYAFFDAFSPAYGIIAPQDLTPVSCLRLAAASISKNISLRCKISGFSGAINMEYSPRKKTLKVLIFDKNDEDLSQDLDGASIISEEGEVLGTISGGKCLASGLENFDGKIAIRKKSGSIATLKIKKSV